MPAFPALRSKLARRATPRAAALMAAAACIAGAIPATAAAAAPEYNMLGTWVTGYTAGSVVGAAREPANGSYDITQMNMSTGALSGTAEVDGVTFTVGGHESGSLAEFTLTEPGYIAYDRLPLSILSSGHLGTNDGSFGEAGYTEHGAGFWAEQGGASPSEEKARKEKEEAEKAAKRPTGTTVTCNYEFASSENTCVAQVGDGGAQPPVTPTGTVTWTTTSGGFGNGATCSLTATPLSPAVASCTLTYFTANSGLPSITATYQGDSRHSGSVGHTQFLGEISETSFEAPTGPSGQYPNEVALGTEVPVAGTTVEGIVQGHISDPLPVPIVLPAVQSSLDAMSATDLRIAEALTSEVDVEGAQKPSTVTELDHSVEVLDARAVELGKGSSAEQLRGQQLLKDAAASSEEITTMLKTEGEFLKGAIEGNVKVGRADQSIEKLDAKAVELLKSASPAEEAKGQAELDEANKTLEALLKAAKQKGEILKKVIGNASAASSLSGIKAGRVRPLGHVTRHGVPAGKLKLRIPLSRSALKKLAGAHASITVYVRLDMVLPSRAFPKGVPRSFVQRVTLKRSPKSKPHAKK